MTTRAPTPKVSSPIVFQAERGGPEHIAHPCSRRHRELWLTGYIILSCTKCRIVKPEEGHA